MVSSWSLATRFPAFLVISFVVAACSRLLPGSVRCPAAGGPEWREYKSKHFVVDSDLDAAEAAPLVQQLETLQAMVIGALIREDRDVAGYARVIVPAEPLMYSDLAPAFSIGAFAITWLG